MAASSSPSPGDSKSVVSSGPSLRILGIAVLGMFLLTSVVGGSLALESSYLPLTLGSHIGLAIVTLGIAGYATSLSGRYYRTLPRVFAAIAAFAARGATIAGTVFLLGGQTDAALYAMEGLALLGIFAALVIVVVGGPSAKRVMAPSTR